MATRDYGRTVVQHSGYGYGGDPMFRRGLESRHLSTQAERNKVIKAGGVVFSSYNKAENYAEQEMWRHAGGFVPAAPGAFSGVTVDELRVYVPPFQRYYTSQHDDTGAGWDVYREVYATEQDFNEGEPIDDTQVLVKECVSEEEADRVARVEQARIRDLIRQ